MYLHGKTSASLPDETLALIRSWRDGPIWRNPIEVLEVTLVNCGPDAYYSACAETIEVLCTRLRIRHGRHVNIRIFPGWTLFPSEPLREAETTLTGVGSRHIHPLRRKFLTAMLSGASETR